MKTLQQEYQLIKEGKGNKDHFLKVAKYMFPEYITSGNDFDSAIHILKSKSLLSEGIGGIISQSPIQPDWFKIFNTKIAEAVGVKNTKEYGDQNEFEKIDKDVAKALESNFDNNNPDNIDNVYGQSFLMGFYTEMQDEKNKDKSVYELKQIVLKNMVKNINYYATEASFGVKGIGYKKDVVGGGEPVEPKGKYKSSGYGDIPKIVKEGIHDRDILSRPSSNPDVKPLKRSPEELGKEADSRSENMLLMKYQKQINDLNITDDELRYILSGQGVKGFGGRTNAIEKIISNRNANKSLNEAKRPSVNDQIKELEKSSQAIALEAKLTAIDEAIEKRKAKLALAESEELAEMIDQSMVKTLNKEIKELEKHKAKTQKIYEKMTGKAKEEVIDEDKDIMNY
jgi:hypothetical protein